MFYKIDWMNENRYIQKSKTPRIFDRKIVKIFEEPQNRNGYVQIYF